jgi:lysozyme
MTPRHQATRAAIELIKRFEGFRSKAAQLPDGRWTIGYGHTRTARAGAQISEADADALLIYDVAGVITAINEWVYSPLTQNQFDALAAFVFNIGLQNFRRSSVLRRLNEGAPLQAACAMEMWRTADFEGERIVIDALVRRRAAEMALFLTPQDGFIPVPSLIVIPRVDDAVARAAPVQTAELASALDGDLAQAMRSDASEPPLASRAAAEAVTARLNALLRDPAPAPAPDMLVGPPLPPEDEMAISPMPEPALRPVTAEPASEPAAEAAEPAAEAAPPAESPPAYPPMGSQPLVFRPRSTLKMPKKRTVPESVLVAMGLLGLGGAGAGAFWGFSADAAERLPLLPDPEVTGLGVSLIGVALLVASVYLLLTRLASRD